MASFLGSNFGFEFGAKTCLFWSLWQIISAWLVLEAAGCEQSGLSLLYCGSTSMIPAAKLWNKSLATGCSMMVYPWVDTCRLPGFKTMQRNSTVVTVNLDVGGVSYASCTWPWPVGLCFDAFTTAFAMLYILTANISGRYYQPPHLGGCWSVKPLRQYAWQRQEYSNHYSRWRSAEWTVMSWARRICQWLLWVLLRHLLVCTAVTLPLLDVKHSCAQPDMSHELSQWIISFCMFL